MIGQTISHYQILEKLGEGGMGVVYKAKDLKLDRFVALKFLPPQLGPEDEARTRFIHEAKSASSLDHPNICTIHEVEETPDGQTFIVMPFYEGEALSSKLTSGPMEVAEAVDIVHQVASGLAKAHEKGIVHRDLKPGNILVTHDGQVKLVDFGLAKLVGQTRFTRTGTTLGTPFYMSPEQALGDEVDVRSDVFSLGVVLYELLTGRLPFKGEHEAAILYGIVHEDPQPMSKFRGDVPETLQHIVEKALEKDVEERYQDASELRDELEAFLEGIPTAKRVRPRIAGRRRGFAAAVGRGRAVAIVVSAVAVGAIAWVLVSQRGAVSTGGDLALAVMDFKDLATPEDRTVSAGMTGLVHVGLVESSPIRVVSPEYLYDLRRRLFDAARGPIEEHQALEVAREAGAEMLLSGQMAKVGDEPYVTWRLVDTRSGKTLAAKVIEGDKLTDLADSVIAGVLPLLARESGVEAPASPPSVSTLTTESDQAYRHFVAGILAREEARTLDALRELEQAVRLDSTFAIAFFELSRTKHLDFEIDPAREYAEKAWVQRARLGVKDRMRVESWRQFVGDRHEEALATYREMHTRWPDDRNVLSDLCDILFYNWYFDEVVAVAGQGLRLYPDDLIFGNLYGTSLAYTGRLDEALEATRTYVERCPENPNAWDDLGLRFLSMGLPDSAEVAYRRALDIDPNFVGSLQGLGYCDYCRGDVGRAIGRFDELLKRGDLSPDERSSVVTSVKYWPGLTLLHAEAGRFQKALDIFEEALQTATGPDSGFVIEERNNLLLRMGRADEVLWWARTLEEWADSRYAQLKAIRYRVRALVRLDSLEAARVAAAELEAVEEEGGVSEPFLMLRVAADLALGGGDHEGAVEALGEMKRHGVPFGGIYDIERREDLARAHRMAGRLREAAAVLEELLRVYGGHALAHHDLGQIYEEMRRPSKAESAYAMFLELWSEADPGLPQVEHARRRLNALRARS